MNKNEPNPERFPERFEVHSTASDHLGWLRTRLAVERTLMAWLRTAVALIAFGFTIFQFFEWLQSQGTNKPVLFPEAPRDLGLALIGAGVLGSVISLWEYCQLVSYLWSDEFGGIAGIAKKPHRTPLFAVSMLIAFVGVVAFVTVLFRLS